MDTGAKSHRQRMLVWLAWCVLLTLAWGLWLHRLDASDLTFDEAGSYFIAHRSPKAIISYLQGAVREHPPVYYLLVGGWIGLAGTSEFSLRLFSVVAGLAGLVLTGWVARLVWHRSGAVVGLLAGVFLVLLPGMAYTTRNARMYSLGLVWTMLSAGMFLRDWLSREEWPRWPTLPALAIVNLLALFTHYYLLLPILVHPVLLLITRRWRPLAIWLVVHSFLAATGLIWLQAAPGLQMTTAGFVRGIRLSVPSVFQASHLLGKILFSNVARAHLDSLFILLALASAGILFTLWRRSVRGVWLILSLFLPLALAYQVPQPPQPRYLALWMPLFSLALAGLCKAVLKLIDVRWLAWIGVLGLALVAVPLLTARDLIHAITFDRSRYGHTLQTIRAFARPGDGLLFYGPWQWTQFEYYDPGGLPPTTSLPPFAPPRLKPDEARLMLEELFSRHDRLWVVPAAVDDVDPDRFVAGWLNTHAHAAKTTWDYSLYLSPLPPDAPTQSIGATFGDSLSLEQVASERQPVPAGESLRLALYWNPLRRLNDVHLRLALVDQRDHIWDQDDRIPREWADPPSVWQPGQVIVELEGLMVPQGAPPGAYTVRLMVNDGITGEPLRVRGRRDVDVLTVQVTKPLHAPVLHDIPHAQATRFCSPDGSSCLTLAGYEPGGVRFQQGYAVPFKLHWLVPIDTVPEAQLQLRAVHRPWLPGGPAEPIVTRTIRLPSQKPLAAAEPPPEGAKNLLPRVVLPIVIRDGVPLPERLITSREALVLPPDAATGPAQITLEVLGPDSDPWSWAEDESTFALFDITVDDRPVLRRPPRNLTSLRVEFGAEVALVGYRFDGDAIPGGELQLTYAWYARTNPTAIYAVFSHLLTADGTLVAQVDGWPQGGRMLTTQWQSGEYVEDRHVLPIPPDAPSGPYTVFVGLYDAATSDRQPAFQDDGRLPGDQVPIPVIVQGGS